MSAGVDPFWVPPEEFGRPRDLVEIAEELRDVTVLLGRVVRACHAVRPRVNLRPTLRELGRLRLELQRVAGALVDAQQVLEDDAPLAVDFPGSDQVPWVFRENPVLSPKQLLALRNLALPSEERHDGLRYAGPLISYRDVLQHTEAEPQHIADCRRDLAASVKNVVQAAEELIDPGMDRVCPRCGASPREGCRTPSGVAARLHKARRGLAPPAG